MNINDNDKMSRANYTKNLEIEKGVATSFKCSVTHGEFRTTDDRFNTIDINVIPNKVWWVFSDLYSREIELGTCTYDGSTHTFIPSKPDTCDEEICKKYV